MASLDSGLSSPPGSRSSVCLGLESTYVCTHAQTRVHTCTHAQGPAPAPQSACVAKQMSRDSRSPSLAGHHQGDRQMDRQTGHAAPLFRPCLGDRWTDRPLCCQGVWTDGQPLAVQRPPGCASSARRLHLVEDAPQGAGVGTIPWGGSQRARVFWAPPARQEGPSTTGTAGGSQYAGMLLAPLPQMEGPSVPAMLAPGQHPGCLHSTSLCLIIHYAPVQSVHQGNKCSGIYFNRWRIIFCSPFNGHSEHRAARRRRAGGLCRARPAAPAQGGFLSCVGEFRSSKQEEGMKRGGKSCRAVPVRDALACGVAAPGLCQQQFWVPAPHAAAEQPLPPHTSRHSAAG